MIGPRTSIMLVTEHTARMSSEMTLWIELTILHSGTAGGTTYGVAKAATIIAVKVLGDYGFDLIYTFIEKDADSILAALEIHLICM